jgi:transposase
MRLKKFNEEQLKLIQKIREAGLTYKQIADRFFVSVGTIRYLLLPAERERCNRNAKKIYKKSKGKWAERNKKWRRANPEKYQKSICLSLLKGNLNRGTIKKEEVLEVLKNAGC